MAQDEIQWSTLVGFVGQFWWRRLLWTLKAAQGEIIKEVVTAVGAVLIVVAVALARKESIYNTTVAGGLALLGVVVLLLAFFWMLAPAHMVKEEQEAGEDALQETKEILAELLEANNKYRQRSTKEELYCSLQTLQAAMEEDARWIEKFFWGKPKPEPTQVSIWMPQKIRKHAENFNELIKNTDWYSLAINVDSLGINFHELQPGVVTVIRTKMKDQVDLVLERVK